MKPLKSQNTLKAKFHLPYEDYTNHHPFCQTIRLPNQSVRDALRDEIGGWDCRYPVLIDAPTGLGKTTFVYEELLPRAINKGKNILLISNRIALSVQQKLKILQLTNSPLQGMLTDKGIQAQEHFGSVAVTTYHRLISFLSDEDNRKWCDKLEYVVADEAHFFTSDSLFNNSCDTILKQITSRFCRAIRIYLTATPWDVIHRLAEAEQENYRNFEDTFAAPRNRMYMEKRFMLHYCFERNYDHCDLKFFQDFSELVPLINENSAEKWLIFIDNKEAAADLKKELHVPTVYLDSSRKGIQEWSELLLNEKFEAKVLISTSVLDCGINICDPELKNIVIVSDNRTSIMQMAGRKRCEKGESITVWVQELSGQKIASRYKCYVAALQLEQKFDSVSSDKGMQILVNQLWNSKDDAVRSLFSVMLHSVHKNRCAFVYIRRMARFFEIILNNQTTFQNEVEDWFGKKHPAPVSEIDSFYEQHKYTDLTEEEKANLRKIIARAYKNSGRTEAQPRRDNLQHTALNNRLREMELPYEIQPKNGKWQLNYIEPNSIGGGI